MAEALEIKQDKYTLLFKILAWTFIIFQIILIAAVWSQLNERIAIHFNGSGEPNGFGSRIILWILPSVNMLIVLFMMELAKSSSLFNYPVKITEENKDIQYQLAYKALMAVTAGTSALLFLVVVDIIRTDLYGSNTHGLWILLQIFLLIILPVIIYIRMAKNRA